jgi:hypothetical protein
MTRCLVPIVLVVLSGLCGCKSQSDPEARTILADNAPPATNRVLGLPEGWELAPAAKYTASQTPGEVIIKASGQHPSSNYEAKLFMSPLRIWPPQYLLARHKTGDMGAQVITPFETTASFKSTDKVESVRVTDGAGAHDVPVDQARD